MALKGVSSERDIERMGAKILAYQNEHPEDMEALGLWMASGEIAELQYPEACARFEKLFPGQRG
jgi:hypothetical protein